MTHFRTCPLCEAMCGLAIETDGDRVTRIAGDPDDVFSHGFICPKGPALKAIHEDPDRLRQPVRRTKRGDFEPIGWEEAIAIAADGIHRVQEEHGRDAAAIYVGNPTVHNLGALLFVPMLIRALRTRNRYSATSVDQLPHHLAAHLMFGHQFLLPIPDIDRTDLFVIIGANPVASNGSLMTAAGMPRRLKAIQERGGRVIVIDPRRTETAEVADEHHFIRPGSDAWLLAAILSVALKRGRGLGRLEEHTEGLAELRRELASFTPERAAGPTGISAAAIEGLADEICKVEHGVVYGRMGVSTQRFGAVCQWLINAINLVTGHFDEVGGAMFTSPALDAINLPAGFGLGKGSYGRFESRVRGLKESGGELPVAALAEEMLTPGRGQVRCLLTSAGNPVLSTPNGAQLERAIAGLDHVVSIDLYVNETTRHANVILPPTSPLERPHYDAAFHHLAVRNTTKLSLPLFEPGPDARDDWQIMLDLIVALEQRRGQHGIKERARTATLRRLGPLGLLDIGLRVGPHGFRAVPLRRGISVDALEKAPHGIDLGPLQPTVPERTRKWREKIDLAPALFVHDLERLAQTERETGGGLSLIGRRHLRSNNSWMHNAPKLVAGKPLCTLLIHPDDAAERDIADGAEVEVTSRVGQLRVAAELSDAVMRGVVSLPHGFGHDRDGVMLRVAREVGGASVNDVTDHELLDVVSGNAALNGVPVTVRRADLPAEA